MLLSTPEQTFATANKTGIREGQHSHGVFVKLLCGVGNNSNKVRNGIEESLLRAVMNHFQIKAA